MTCDHVFDVPLFGSTGTDWSDEIVGFACSRCWYQLFDGESLTWFGSSNVTVYLDGLG